jgi:arginase family enzyme
MRKVFSSNELSETVLIRDALLHGGVAATIQNEYSGRTAVPEFRPPAEVWVTNDHDYDDARRIVVDALATIDANTHLHVSFDVDFLDADIAPGVGTTVKGGPTYREAQLCMEMIADCGALSSLDVMELNPALDVRNRTAEVAVDLIESLFGKSTLMRKGA